jgi:hypothetical protein
LYLEQWFHCTLYIHWLPAFLSTKNALKVYMGNKTQRKVVFSTINIFAAQTREQTLGGTFLWYEKSILGCWLWVVLGCGIKGLGRWWATFEGGFFNFLWAKKTTFFCGNNFLFQKNQFFLGLNSKYIEVGNRLLSAILWFAVWMTIFIRILLRYITFF